VVGTSQRYGVILADPPWNWRAWSRKGESRSAKQHYDVMEIEDVMDLYGFVDPLCSEDCVLFLWATFPLIEDALATIHAWDFDYKGVAFTWVKTNNDGSPWMGLGYWTRHNAEVCLLGTRGHPKRKSRSVREVIISPRRGHSRKPEEQYERIEALVDGPYLELFARPPHPRGWNVWGKEAEGGIE